MKKLLLIALSFILTTDWLKSQCVATCSNYITYTVPYAPYPTAGNDAIALFTPNTDDGLTSPISIGFNFTYYCTTYSTVLIYSNGMIQFDIGVPSTFPFGYDPAQNFPSGSVPNGLVAFRMDDLDPTVGGAVNYTTLGTSPSQTFVVTYSNVPLFGNPSLLYSGQIALYETTNLIDIITILSPQGSNLATQGIEDATGSNGTGVPQRNQTYWGASSPGTWRFQGIGPSTLAPISGTISSCQGIANTYSIAPIPGALYYNWSLPGNWSGTSTTSAITATAGASGNLSLTATFTCGVTAPVSISVSVIQSPTVAMSSATPNIFCAGPTVTFMTSGAASYTIQPGNLTGTPPFFHTPTTNTSYTLTGVNASGCESKNTSVTFITVKDNPTVTVNSGSICLGATFNFTTSGAVQYTNSAGLFGTATPSTVGNHTYSVVGTGSNACVSSVVISTVTVLTLPSLTATATRSAICVKESTSLTASGALTYTWSVAAPNATNTVISVKPITTTMYTLTGTDNNGCVNTKTVTLQVNACTGIGQEDVQQQFEFFPNPAKNVLNLKLNTNAHVSIINMLGQKVYSATVDAGETILPIENFSAGQYLIEFSSGENRCVEKFIIE